MRRAMAAAMMTTTVPMMATTIKRVISRCIYEGDVMIMTATATTDDGDCGGDAMMLMRAMEKSARAESQTNCQTLCCQTTGVSYVFEELYLETLRKSLVLEGFRPALAAARARGPRVILVQKICALGA